MGAALSYHEAMRSGGFRNVGGLAQRLTSSVAKGRGTSIARLAADWPTIVGPELSRTTLPEKLSASRGGHAGAKSLRLRVAGSAALEVQHMSVQLIDRVNAYFGYRAIDDIKLVQGQIALRPLPRIPRKPDPAAVAAAEKRVADVEDPDLRAVLARLGAQVASRRLALFGLLAALVVPAAEPRAQDNPLSITAKDRVLGRPEAPITIIEYASLSCWSCARFHMETLPPVKRNWIDSGRAKLVYRHFPLDNVATRAGHLVECLSPAAFFPAIEALFRSQDQWTKGADPFAEAAKAANQSPSQAKACQVNGQVLDKVLSDVQSGQKLGVTSTPTLFINGQKHDNPGDPAAFEALLRRVR